jgi:hypothetical protein
MESRCRYHIRLLPKPFLTLKAEKGYEHLGIREYSGFWGFL